MDDVRTVNVWKSTEKSNPLFITFWELIVLFYFWLNLVMWYKNIFLFFRKKQKRFIAIIRSFCLSLWFFRCFVTVPFYSLKASNFLFNFTSCLLGRWFSCFCHFDEHFLAAFLLYIFTRNIHLECVKFVQNVVKIKHLSLKILNIILGFFII